MNTLFKLIIWITEITLILFPITLIARIWANGIYNTYVIDIIDKLLLSEGVLILFGIFVYSVLEQNKKQD